jgi:hypothetical protein
MKRLKMNFIKNLMLVLSALIGGSSSASDLKVFGSEFCNMYNANTCINFHYKKIKDAKNFLGQYKYPSGRKAYDDCHASSPQTDGALAYCSMLFHREEQNEKQRATMCTKDMIDKFWQTSGDLYAMDLYFSVWKCNLSK